MNTLKELVVRRLSAIKEHYESGRALELALRNEPYRVAVPLDNGDVAIVKKADMGEAWPEISVVESR